MIYRLLLLFCFLGVGILCRAQTLLRIFYRTNEYRLSQEQKDSLLSVSRIPGLRSVIISSYTDSVDSDAYNDSLSFRRASEISGYLVASGVDKQKIALYWHGEKGGGGDNSKEEGREWNRRSEIVLNIDALVSKPEQPACDEDTSIVFPQGSVLIFNRCEYQRIRECLQVTEAFDAGSVEAQGLTTMTSEGELLISCGMLDIRLKTGCPDTCFNYPVKVLFPLFSGADSCERCSRNARLYRFFANGLWNPRPEQQNVELVTVGGRKYYRFEIRCPGRINCDCSRPGVPVKFKAKNRLRLASLQVIYSCPLGVYRFRNNGKHANRMEVSLLCVPGAEDRRIQAIAIDRKGDTLVIQSKLLNELKKRYSKPACRMPGKEVVKKILFWKFYRARLYRKYILKRKDFSLKS